jgi:UPF0755 protein
VIPLPWLPFLWILGPLLVAGVALSLLGRRRLSQVGGLLLFLLLPLSASVSARSAALFWGPVPPASGRPVTVVIEPGTPLPSIAARLAERGIIARPGDLVAAARLSGRDRAVQAGRYRFPGGEGVVKVLARLINGNTADELVTIPEGLRADRIAGLLARLAEVDSAAFMTLLGDSTLIADLLGRENGQPLPAGLDGYLLPDTYNIYYRMPAEEVVRLMVGAFTDLWRGRLMRPALELGLSRTEVVTLASIIEREAARDSDRPLVSAVFHNRLRRGMRLESCATVLFALGRWKRRLYEKDLAVDHPYNTYRIRGLPPGPIANPGRASLEAAVHPASTDVLYFVANGDGTHTFSRTYQEHLRAKQGAGEGVLVGTRPPGS